MKYAKVSVGIFRVYIYHSNLILLPNTRSIQSSSLYSGRVSRCEFRCLFIDFLLTVRKASFFRPSQHRIVTIPYQMCFGNLNKFRRVLVHVLIHIHGNRLLPFFVCLQSYVKMSRRNVTNIYSLYKD